MVASPDYLGRKGTPKSFDDLSQREALIYAVPRYRDKWPLKENGVRKNQHGFACRIQQWRYC